MTAITHVPRRIRRTLAMLAIALCATLTVALAAAGTASAAGPNYLEPGQWVTYPTWSWGYTQVCAYNYGPGWGMVEIRKRVWDSWGWYGSNWVVSDRFGIDPYTTRCGYYTFYGAQIGVENVGIAPVSTYTQ